MQNAKISCGFFFSDWILFFQQNSVLWVPAIRSLSNYANKYTGPHVWSRRLGMGPRPAIEAVTSIFVFPVLQFYF